MLKKVLIFLIVAISIMTSMSLMKIEKKEYIKNTIEMANPIKTGIINRIPVQLEEQPIGKIKIPKLNIKKVLYDINSKKNNIEENITILNGSIYPDQENSILYIAAHSGTGDIAFFKDLDQLKIKDEVIIEYKNEEYTYVVQNIYEQEKDGYISGRRENKKQLVLTTCCPKKENCQLIINCTIKES